MLHDPHVGARAGALVLAVLLAAPARAAARPPTADPSAAPARAAAPPRAADPSAVPSAQGGAGGPAAQREPVAPSHVVEDPSQPAAQRAGTGEAVEPPATWDAARPAPPPGEGWNPQPASEPPPPTVPPHLPPAAPPDVPSLPPPRRGVGLMTSGFIVLGISYLATAITGAVLIDDANNDFSRERSSYERAAQEAVGRRLLVPGIGPFLAIAPARSAFAGLGLGLVGAVQVTGLALAAGGIVRFARHRRQRKLKAGVSTLPGGGFVRLDLTF